MIFKESGVDLFHKIGYVLKKLFYLHARDVMLHVYCIMYCNELCSVNDMMHMHLEKKHDC